MKPSVTVLLAGALSVLLPASPAIALPTMIRLGYIDCASCHYSPQGGGPLNPYGRGIDEAQSLRAGEYRPRDNKLVRIISWNGRIAQDLRLVFPMQRAWASHESTSSFRPRLLYRNFTELPQGFAVHVTVTGETDAVPRPARAYDPAPDSSSPIVNVALLRFRVSQAVELYAGRDQLPTGVNVPDLGAFIRQRNRLGFYDSPAQVKMNWAGKRFRVTPFAYAPGGNEAEGERESGAGTLAEADPFGSHHVVVGINLLRGSADNGNREMVGAHARLGFEKWGILAEHDVTSRGREGVPSASARVNSGALLRDASPKPAGRRRTTESPVAEIVQSGEPSSFRQHTSYGQAFWAVREWLVTSLIGERLSVRQPFEERINAGRVEVAARLTSVATVTVSTGIQRDLLTDRTSKSLVFQVALKTVY